MRDSTAGACEVRGRRAPSVRDHQRPSTPPHRHVAAPCDRPDDGLRIVIERATNLEQALREGIVGDGSVGPDRLNHFVFGDELPVVHDQVCEDVEALGPEGHGHAVPEQESSVEIEDERSESILAPTLFIRD